MTIKYGDSRFEDLLLEYGDRMLDCGEWDNGSIASYERLRDKANQALDKVFVEHQRIIDEYNKIYLDALGEK